MTEKQNLENFSSDNSENWLDQLISLATEHSITIGIIVGSCIVVSLIWYFFLSNQQTGGNSEESIESSLFESETYTSLNGGEALPRCTLYYANWCGHCKVLKPTWQQLIESDKFKGKVQFEEVEADENPEKIQEQQIEGFPTIKITKDAETVEYQGDRTIEDLEKFLDENI